ncbi:MAG: phosphatase PAP2 family protein [Paludibacteraceae bacterium]|nr:phosphatase PAP2 family protein [Paludibacteraceae bacterium]
MSDKFANIVSWVFQPLVVPFYGLVALWFAPFFYDYAPQTKLSLLALLAFALVLIPLLCYLLMRKIDFIKTPQADNRLERTGIYAITVFCYLVAGFILMYTHVGHVYTFVVFVMAACLMVLSVINFFWKISAHAMGMGAMLSAMLMLMWYNQTDRPFIYIVWILLTGLVCAARLQVRAHTPAQLVAGFSVGFVPLFTLLLLMN